MQFRFRSCTLLVPPCLVSLFPPLLQLIIDVNIAVAVEAIQAIGNLAKGLRTHFSGNSRFLLPILLVSMLLEAIDTHFSSICMCPQPVKC